MKLICSSIFILSLSIISSAAFSHEASPYNSSNLAHEKNEDEPNNFPHLLGGSHYASCHDSISGYISSDDLDYFFFYLPSKTLIDISTSGDVDTVGTLYISNYINGYLSPFPIISNDDSGENNNFRIHNIIMNKGFYYFLLKGYTKKSVGRYNLNVGCHVLEHVNTNSKNWLNEATEIRAFPYSTNTHLENINYPGDNDLFMFEVEGGTKKVTAYTKGTTDTIGTIYNKYKTPFLVNNDGGDNKNFKISANLKQGRYYLSVSASKYIGGRYSLHIEIE